MVQDAHIYPLSTADVLCQAHLRALGRTELSSRLSRLHSAGQEKGTRAQIQWLQYMGYVGIARKDFLTGLG